MSLLHKLLEDEERESMESNTSVASSPSVWSLLSHHDTLQSQYHCNIAMTSAFNSNTPLPEEDITDLYHLKKKIK
jgi:hypothetical protein